MCKVESGWLLSERGVEDPLPRRSLVARRLLLGASNKPTSRLSCESGLLEPLDLVQLMGSHLLDELLDGERERLFDLDELHPANNIPVLSKPQCP